jgi:hypothetical protein
MTTQTIGSWPELAQLVERSANASWVFRGESRLTRPLMPKAGRVGTYSGAARKKPYSAAAERAALDAFKKQARPYLGHTPAFDLEWLAIAQHHGMSTRLLDWTESLLVAAYFAVVDVGVKGDAVIYAVKGLRAVAKAEEENPLRARGVGVYRPPHISPRIPAQRSVFTLHPNPTLAFAPPGLQQWRVARAACGRIKAVLDACAINEASLFPDIDGLSRYLGWRYKWGKP